MSSPAISLIVCTIDASQLGMLGDSLSRQQDLPEAGVELIVAHSGVAAGEKTLPESVQILDELPFWSVREVFCEQLGQTRARNAGLLASRGSIIAWTDDDTEPYPDWLARLCQDLFRPATDESAADVTCGQVVLAQHLDRDWMQDCHRSRLAAANPRRASDIVGANMAFRRVVLEDIPRFDEQLGPGALGFQDDTLFGTQLDHAGYRFAYVPDAVVTHHFDANRLLREAWIGSAIKLSRSLAHVDHHWRHLSVPWLRARWLRKKLQLTALNLLQGRQAPPDAEGISSRELSLLHHLHYYEALLNERKRPRRYERHGMHPLDSTPT